MADMNSMIHSGDSFNIDEAWYTNKKDFMGLILYRRSPHKIVVARYLLTRT